MIVGLTGYARVGKDSAGAVFQQAEYRRLGFADELKTMALAINPIIDGCRSLTLRQIVRDCGWERAKDWYPETRAFLQRLGVSMRNLVSENFWVDQVDRQISDGEPVVITDVRFPNEADWIHSKGGVVVRVERPGFGPVGDHESELGVDLIRPDFQLLNDGNLGDLQVEVRRLLRAIHEVEATA